MNPISKALAEIKYRIPRAVLEKAFLNASMRWYGTLAANVEHQIEHLVIRPRVMVDCNLSHGVERLIPLEGLAFQQPYQNATVIHIPKTLTQNRSIISALSVVFFNPGIGGNGLGQLAGYAGTTGAAFQPDNSAAMAAAAQLMASYDKIPKTSTERVQLIAENTILVDDNMMLPGNSWLRCVIEHDENMANLPLKAYRQFSTAVELATKAYIYNTLVIEMDRGQLHAGLELGSFKNVVDTYADAEANYQDFMAKRMGAVLFMSDEIGYNRFIRTIVGNRT